MNLNLIYEERWLTDSAFETLVACAVGVFSRPWPCKGSVSRSSNFLLKSSCLRKNACNCSITVFPLWAVSTGVLKRGSRTRDTVGVDDLRGVGMTAGTKGVDSVVSRKVLIDPWELPDASRILGVEWTAELSSWCSGRPQACTPCETIVLEVLLDLAGVLRVSDEHLEGLVDCSVMIRCLDLLGICLAMDSPSKRTVQFETKSEKSRLKFKCNSSPCRSWSLTTLKNILIYHWVMQDFMLSSLLEYIIAVSVQSLLLFAACACIVFLLTAELEFVVTEKKQLFCQLWWTLRCQLRFPVHSWHHGPTDWSDILHLRKWWLLSIWGGDLVGFSRRTIVVDWSPGKYGQR